MSYDQQSSHHQPWLSEPGPEVEVLSPLDAEKSRRWRLVLGCSSVFLGLASGFYAYTDISLVIRAMNTAATSGGYIPADAMSHAIAGIAVLCALSLAYVGVGTWNIVTRLSTAKSPLIAAIILAAAALILIVVYMTAKSTGVRFGGLGLNALIISRAAILLRMRRPLLIPQLQDGPTDKGNKCAAWRTLPFMGTAKGDGTNDGSKMSSDFEVKGPNVIASKDGELRIARVGLSVRFRGREYEIDSEMLAPPMSIAIYFRDSSAAKAAAKAHELEQLREFVRDALIFRGFDVEFD